MSFHKKVIWDEGLFLQPQHFQQHDRYFEHLLESRVQPLLPYAYGFTQYQIDRSALKHGRIGIASASGIFPDGTPFSFPDYDAAPDGISLSIGVQGQVIALALPERRPGQIEIAQEGDDGTQAARYLRRPVPLADATKHGSEQVPIDLAELKLKLLPANQDFGGYTKIGFARVKQLSDGEIELDDEYIAPCLSARHNDTLSGFVRELHGALRHRGDALVQRPQAAGVTGVSDVNHFLWLQTINRYEPLFAHLENLGQLHPERLFATCLQLMGDLSTFRYDQRRRPKEATAYRHDDLGACFQPLMRDLRDLLARMPDDAAIQIPLTAREHGFYTTVIQDPELLDTAEFVLAINAQVPTLKLRASFPELAKVGPAEEIQNVMRSLVGGIPVTALTAAPREVPLYRGYSYFALEKDNTLWHTLEKSKGLVFFVSAREFPDLKMELWAIPHKSG